MAFGDGKGGGGFEFDPNRIPEMPKIQLPKLPTGMARTLIIGIVALALLWMSFYQVQPEEVGIVLRFGEYIKTTEPGLRMKIPFVDQVEPVPVQRQLNLQFGFRFRGIHADATRPRIDSSSRHNSSVPRYL